MRVEPAAKIRKKYEVPFQVRLERTTRMIAIIVALVSTFFFFFKILFL